LCYHWSINLFGRLHKWEEKNKTHLTCSKTLLKQECQENSGCDVIRNFTRQCRNEIQNDWISAWYLKLVLTELKLSVSINGPPVSLCWHDRVYCGIGSTVCKCPEISQSFCTCAAYF
jgi:hypothetical protein